MEDREEVALLSITLDFRRHSRASARKRESSGWPWVPAFATQRLFDSPRGPDVYANFWTSAYQAIDD